MRATDPRGDGRLDRLLQAAELCAERDATALAALRRDIADLRARLSGLHGQPGGDLLTAGFAQSGGMARWQARCLAERERLNLVLAQRLSHLPKLEAAAGRSAARRLVVTRLKKKR